MEEEIVKKEESNNKKQTTIILVIVIALALVALSYFLFFKGNKSNDEGKDTIPTPTLAPTDNDEGEGPISVTRDGVTKKENIPDGMVGKYVLNGNSKYFILNSDGTAEAEITFSGPDLPSKNDKTYFTKDELTFKLIYEGNNFYLELVPNESLDEVYKQLFGSDGEYYYAGKFENGVYKFEVVNPSAISNPGDSYIKQ